MIPKFPNPNHYPHWIYQSLTLPAGRDSLDYSVQIPRMGSWMLRRAYTQYPTTGAALPTAWIDPTVQLIDLFSNYEFARSPIDLMLFTSPGRYDNFNNGDPRNQQVFESKSIDRLFAAKTSFILRFAGFKKLGAALNIDIALQGEIILKNRMF